MNLDECNYKIKTVPRVQRNYYYSSLLPEQERAVMDVKRPATFGAKQGGCHQYKLHGKSNRLQLTVTDG